jgi:hypothetical protein
MEALRRKTLFPWVVMTALQLGALAIFPYATLMMAGVTGVSVLRQMTRPGVRETWRIPLLYGIACALLDLAFLRNGSVGFYDNRSPAIHIQLQLLPHLIGGNWLLLVALTIVVAVATPLAFEVKWPLIGMGLTNALPMLGDAVVPSTKIFLSHHAAHLVHLTLATLTAFLIAAAATVPRIKPLMVTITLGLLVFVLLTGVLLVAGNYQGSLWGNRELVQLARLQRVADPGDGDLLIARSTTVDDQCGWIVLLSSTPVLFCTDAEVMLTPQQNHDVHRFRQAVYLHLAGDDSGRLQRALASPDPSVQIWRLGYWAEAISPSLEERRQGIEAIQSDLIPWLERVENHDEAVVTFFRKFRRIIVIDSRLEPTFSEDRLASFLSLERKRSCDDFVLSYYLPK